ncbi:MAG TPA: NAD(P)-dependent oxidoreductase [Pirellulales bacterium]|jgi:nucleoside-diphosphate-sugar epimerase|nr:NAD(P)-dependent oxidoreductase [Pirellulales bacterium]
MTTSPAKRVLVTGGTGFIGRHVTASLQARGFEVHLIVRDRDTARALTADAFLHQADLFDESSSATVLRDVAPTHLLHLAWVTAHDKFWTSVENFAWVQASLNLVQHFTAAGGRRIVCAGTCAEYDWSDEHCSEFTTAARPATLYGACKNGLREMVDHYAALHGIRAAWGRLFFLYGPGENRARFLPSLILPLLRGDYADCQCGDHVRDFLHAADAADAFAALLDSEVQGAVNIASGGPVRLAVLANQIAAIAGRPDLLRTGTRPGSPNNPQVLTADTTRLNQEVDWRPRISLERGLKELWQEYDQGGNPEILGPSKGSNAAIKKVDTASSSR